MKRKALSESDIRLVRDKDGNHLEIDGKRVRPDEWTFVREFEEQEGKPPSLIKSWWQRGKAA